MPLWLAGVLVVIIAAVLVILVVFARRKVKKAWTVAAIAVSCVVLLAVLTYIALAFIFLDAARNQPSVEITAVIVSGTNNNNKPLRHICNLTLL
ncbi:MAG: hypothetical protein LBU32_09270 [Clostridiales bacterium]|jgi:multisubunit Na+/H+ antiporter MnhB subunit|nr:hypothetical protein [Clostridiales bacterium]